MAPWIADQNLIICGTEGIGSPSCAFCMVTFTLGSFFDFAWKDFRANAPSERRSFISLMPSSVRTYFSMNCMAMSFFFEWALMMRPSTPTIAFIRCPLRVGRRFTEKSTFACS